MAEKRFYQGDFCLNYLLLNLTTFVQCLLQFGYLIYAIDHLFFKKFSLTFQLYTLLGLSFHVKYLMSLK